MKFNIISEEELLNEFPASKYDLVNGVGALPGLKDRWKLSEKMKELEYYFPPIIDPSVIFNGSCKFLEGVQIFLEQSFSQTLKSVNIQLLIQVIFSIMMFKLAIHVILLRM